MMNPVQSLKILIMCSYYNRPLLVRNALQSVLAATSRHKNWVFAFGDDGSEIPGEPIVREVLVDHLDKVSFYNTNQTIDDKIANGLTIGKLANKVLSKTDADICITLCDDDELHQDYLYNLNRFFVKNRNAMYCWSNISLFNPLIERPGVVNLMGVYNTETGPVEPYGKLDGSQVAFRVAAVQEHGIWYRDTTKSKRKENAHKPWSYNLDGELFKAFFRRFGPCPYTGFVSQHKGVHEHQLVFYKEHVFKCKDDMVEYHRGVIEKAGKEY